jgi:hypothetical protein
MLASKENLGRHLEPFDSLSSDWKTSAKTRDRQNSNCSIVNKMGRKSNPGKSETYRDHRHASQDCTLQLPLPIHIEAWLNPS